MDQKSLINILRSHMARYGGIVPPESEQLVPFFRPLSVRKKQNLLSEGKICTSDYFVVKGCLRMFFINQKGLEQTILFALENWWMSDYTSFATQTPSEFYIQTVEDSEILETDYRKQEELLSAFPVLERYFRLMHQKAHAASQVRIRKIYDFSKEEQYLLFTKNYPEFVNRIPQYLLASFLGFTPEYLSEIRSRKHL